MAKKLLLVLILAIAASGISAPQIFAQETAEKQETTQTQVAQKHKPLDMLIGLGFGAGVTLNIGDLFGGGAIKPGNYAITGDFGLSYDFYLFRWLSFSTGLMLHPDIYLIIPDNLLNLVTDPFKHAASPLCLTIPLMSHINVPVVEWLYVGVGISLNIPVYGLLDDAVAGDTKGGFFAGLPIDLGFDFIKPGKGGSRFIIRFTPEFHEKGTTLPIGFMWQTNNWRIYSTK